MIINLQKFRTKNDSNGNPRKAIVVNYLEFDNKQVIKTGIKQYTFDYMDYTQALHEVMIDKGDYDYLNELQEIEITVKEFNRLKKLSNATENFRIK